MEFATKPAADTNRFIAAGAVDNGLVTNAYLAEFANSLIWITRRR